MIVFLLILLWSLSALHFTRLFSKIRMRFAAIACAVLYTYVTAWILFAIVFEAVDLGLVVSESRRALSLDWDVSHSLDSFLGMMNVLPPDFLGAVFLVAGLIVSVGFLVVFSDCFLIVREACSRSKKQLKDRIVIRKRLAMPDSLTSCLSFLRFRRYCRANC